MAGINMVWIGALGLAGVGGIVTAYLLVPHVASRIDRFFDPASGDTYQADRSIDSFLHGGWFGRGPGEGTVKNVLPDSHTDFIFAVTAEEFGFVGVCVIVTLFALFTWRALRTGLRCMELRQPFNGYVAFGIGLWISLQAFVSIGVNLGILPTKGLTLPLISSGGSSVLMTCAAYGMLLRISCELDRAERRHAARVRGDLSGRVEPSFEEEAAPVSGPMSGQRGHSAPTAAPTPAPVLAVTRGQRARVEPRFGGAR